MTYLHELAFGIYPYIVLSVFLLGSLVRFDREQYTWKSDSSQMLRRGQLRLGSNLFHIGVIGLLFGHFGGLFTPPDLYHALGVSTELKQLSAMVAGGILGSLGLIGLILLVHRRLAEPRIRMTSKPMDIFILLWILATLVLGLLSIFVSVGHPDGSVMLQLTGWAQRIVTFRSGAAALIADVHPIYKIHLMFGMTAFLLFPFSRLVHIWSGFGALAYVTRAYQVVRSRRLPS
jgi:nitrate reductase gamma subunit